MPDSCEIDIIIDVPDSGLILPRHVTPQLGPPKG